MQSAPHGRPQTTTLNAGETLQVIAGANSGGKLWRLTDLPGGAATGSHGSIGSQAIDAGGELTVGPFNRPRRYLVECTVPGQEVTYSQGVIEARAVQASEVVIADAGEHFAGDSVEEALAEVGTALVPPSP